MVNRGRGTRSIGALLCRSILRSVNSRTDGVLGFRKGEALGVGPRIEDILHRGKGSVAGVHHAESVDARCLAYIGAEPESRPRVDVL